MRLAYAADMHGNLTLYQQLLELAISSNAQAVIIGGDLLPHATRLSTALEIQRRFIAQELSALLTQFYTEYAHITVFLLAGNDDWAAAIAALEQLAEQQLAFPLHQRVYLLEQTGAPLWLAGYACVPPTPFSIKDYERRDHGSLRGVSFAQAYWSREGHIQQISEHDLAVLPSIGEDLNQLASQSDPQRTIYVCHTPPINTALDLMRGKRHVGSPSLRSFIEQRQPLLTLHGHIHEAPMLSGSYAECIGSCWAINPGREAERLHAITLDTDDIKGTLWHTVFGGIKNGK